MAEKLSYEDAQKLVRQHLISSVKEYEQFRKSCPNIKKSLPSAPSQFYKDKWVNWSTFLIDDEQITSTPLCELKKIAETMGIKSPEQWHECVKNNQIDAPVFVNQVEGFKSWKWFFGEEDVVYMPFKTLVVYTRKLKLRTQLDWRNWCKEYEKPESIPYDLRKHYYDDYIKECKEKGLTRRHSFWHYIFIGD